MLQPSGLAEEGTMGRQEVNSGPFLRLPLRFLPLLICAGQLLSVGFCSVWLPLLVSHSQGSPVLWWYWCLFLHRCATSLTLSSWWTSEYFDHVVNQCSPLPPLCLSIFKILVACVRMCEHSCTRGDQRRVSDPLELDLQTCLGCHTSPTT